MALPHDIFHRLLSCRSVAVGDDFVRAVERLSGGDSTIAITIILGIFAFFHSGLASLRPKVRKAYKSSQRFQEKNQNSFFDRCASLRCVC